MNKKDEMKIQKRCKNMAINFKSKNVDKKDLFEFGRALQNSVYELSKAEYLAQKIFYKTKDEYKIVEEVLELIRMYRNYMDGKPVEAMLPGADSHILNSVFYGGDYIENSYIVDFLENK